MPEAFLIDRGPAVELFRAMLIGKRRERILRLSGEAKMGKSHMLRVYRDMAEQDWGARCALIDLRSRLQDYSELLQVMVQQLDPRYFTGYQAVHDEFASQPQVQVSGLTALLSRISLRAEEASGAEQYRRRRLATAFLQDLAALPSSPPVVLLFDAFEQATAHVQDWLNESLLIGLSRIRHVWVVVAGRTLPEPVATWSDVCCTQGLPPVRLEDHRKYCAHIGAELSDETIEAFHHVFEGRPGLFVEYVAPKYGRTGVAA